MKMAHLEHGYSQQDIARHTGLHYSSVSRIIQRERKLKTAKGKTCPYSAMVPFEHSPYSDIGHEVFLGLRPVADERDLT